MILGALCGSIALGASNALADSDLGYRIYWGDFHAHSTLSDGFRAPAEAFRWARDVAGLDILALSDHTHLLSASEWELLGKAAREFTEEGRFLALRSQEFGTPVHFGRINIHGCPIRNPNATTNLPATYAFLVEQEAVGVFNPPSTSVGTLFDDLAFHPEFEQAMVGMEVVNARGLCQELWIEALDNGWKLAPFGSGGPGADGSAGAERSKEGKTCVTGVLAEELTEEAVLEALRARRFFASEQRPAGDLLAVRFESGGHPMGSQIAHSGSSIEFEASGISLDGKTLVERLDFFKDGVIVQSHVESGTAIETRFVDAGLADREEHYYFVRVRQADGDCAWSAPIWVTIDAGETSGRTANELPAIAQALPNSPNPFTPETDIRFILPRSANGEDYRVRLTIHDPSGRVIRNLGERSLAPGEHRWTWDGRDDSGTRVASGVYLYRLHGPNLPSSSGRMIFLSR